MAHTTSFCRKKRKWIIPNCYHMYTLPHIIWPWNCCNVFLFAFSTGNRINKFLFLSLHYVLFCLHWQNPEKLVSIGQVIIVVYNTFIEFVSSHLTTHMALFQLLHNTLFCCIDCGSLGLGLGLLERICSWYCELFQVTACTRETQFPARYK